MSLSAEERAEKIVFSIFHEPKMDQPEYENLIAAQIREVEQIHLVGIQL